MNVLPDNERTSGPPKKGVPENLQFGFIQKLQTKKKIPALRAFFVADFETVLNEKKEHVVYGIGVLKCTPGKGVNPEDVVTWFSEARSVYLTLLIAVLGS